MEINIIAGVNRHETILRMWPSLAAMERKESQVAVLSSRKTDMSGILAILIFLQSLAQETPNVKHR